MSTNNAYRSCSNEELLRIYKETKKLEVKQELVLRYVNIVKSVAIQMRDVYLGFAQVEDIVNEGVLVIMNALDKYQLDKNVKFETYISKRIRGMIIDLARKQDWIPRSTRKSARDIEEAVSKLYNEMGREPTGREVSEYLKISYEKYTEIMRKTVLFNILSLDMVLEEIGESRKSAVVGMGGEEGQPEQKLLKKEMGEILGEAIHSLKEKEQMVISLHYVEELNMKQIAGILKVSEPRISQIHSNAIRKLQSYLQSEQEKEERKRKPCFRDFTVSRQA